VSYIEETNDVKYIPNYVYLSIFQDGWNSNSNFILSYLQINGDLIEIPVKNGSISFNEKINLLDNHLLLQNALINDEYGAIAIFQSNIKSVNLNNISDTVPLIPEEVKQYCNKNNIPIDTSLTSEETRQILDNTLWAVVVQENVILSTLECGSSTHDLLKFPYTFSIDTNYKYINVLFM